MGQEKISGELKKALGPAETYEKERVPSVYRPLAEYFLGFLQIDPGDMVLDVACGTGIVARVVAEKLSNNGTFVGVDLDSDMIEVAKSSTPPETSITYHVGSVDNLSFLVSDSFDWVLCQQGFQFFPNQNKALQEIYRVMKPGGRLAMFMTHSVDKESYPFHWAEVEVIRKHVGDEAADKRQFPIWTFKGNSEDLRFLMMEAGFKDIKIHELVSKRTQGFPEEIIVEDDYLDLDPKTRAVVVSDFRKAVEPLRTEKGTEVSYGSFLTIGTK